jgi:carbon starvation protein CstA
LKSHAAVIGLREVQCFLIQTTVERLMEKMIAFGTFLIVMYLVASSIPLWEVLQGKGYLNFMKFLRQYLHLVENSRRLLFPR